METSGIKAVSIQQMSVVMEICHIHEMTLYMRCTASLPHTHTHTHTYTYTLILTHTHKHTHAHTHTHSHTLSLIHAANAKSVSQISLSQDGISGAVLFSQLPEIRIA